MNKTKTILITTFLSLGLAVGIAVPTAIAISNAINSGTPRNLSSEITPTKPGRGETVSFLPESLTRFWQMDDLLHTYTTHAPEIGELTPYNDELLSWTNYYAVDNTEDQKNAIRTIFNKYDLFRPTNNILAWDSKVEAKSYRVIISQDKTFSTIEREYVTNSGSETSVVFENPYTGVDYYWQVIATKNDDSLVYSDIFNFTVANLPRTVLIEGVSNTRDLGGNVGLGGKRMKQGLIYRGMNLEAITTEGTAELKNKLGINTEVDLRGEGEGKENYLTLANYGHFSSPLGYANDSGSKDGIETEGPTSLVGNFGNAIKYLANPSHYPAYFHCAVGRDRTGWMGLCLNFLCGVSEEVALKEFSLSLFSTSGAYIKGTTAFYDRFNGIVSYLNTFDGANLSEKTENYLIEKAGVTHEECETIRGILLGDIDVGFTPGVVNPDTYNDLVKVTFRRYGQTPIIKLVATGSLLDEPNMSGNGAWYHGNDLWDFEHDTVTEDMYLDYISNDKYKVVIHYSGINLPDEAIDVNYNTQLDFSMFAKDGYTYKVYDSSYNQIQECLVVSDVFINVVYTSTSGFVPKSNSRFIVMAGQSNAAGVGHYPYLEESLDEAKLQEINNGYDNVLITGYSNGEIDGWKKVNATKHSISLGTPGTFGFEVGMADRLSKAFPNETTYIVKYGFGSASLNYEWISPSARDVIEECVAPVDPNEDRGWLYDGLVSTLTNAIQSIGEATNTIPMVEAFMWMQGESDSAFDRATELYLETFDYFMDDFLTTFEDNISYKFALYDAAICETWSWPHPEEINAAKRSRVDDKNVYIDTNARITTSFEPVGTGTDGAHYDAACYIDLGHMFADAYLTKTLKGYKVNSFEIEEPAKIVLSRGQTYVISNPVVTFNGTPVEAKMSYFAKQYVDNNSDVYSYFRVDGNTITAGNRTGESQLRITAYYNHEVRTILIPVQVTF